MHYLDFHKKKVVWLYFIWTSGDTMLDACLNQSHELSRQLENLVSELGESLMSVPPTPHRYLYLIFATLGRIIN